MEKNQEGFGLVGVFILIFVLAIVVFIGWQVYSGRTVIRNAPASQTTLKAPAAQPTLVDKLHAASLPEVSTATWQNFQESSGRIAYEYPADWTFKNSGLIYYGPSEATSTNKSAIQTLTSPDGDTKGDYDYKYKSLSGARITVRVSYNKDASTSSTGPDYCTTQKQDKFYLAGVPNEGSPLCLGMTSDSFYQIGASYCGLTFQADIIFGSQNSIEQKQKDLQVLVGIAKTWQFKNVCSTDTHGIEHLYFGP